MTIMSEAVRNGVDTTVLFATLDAVKQQPELGRFQFRARELYRVRDRGTALESGFVEPRQELVVESAMEAGWLFIDSARMAIRFPFGARATFRVAKEPLLLFADPARWAPVLPLE